MVSVVLVVSNVKTQEFIAFSFLGEDLNWWAHFGQKISILPQFCS